MLPQLAADKANHLVYGALVYLVAALAAVALHLPRPDLLGLAAAALAGAIKETADYIANRRAGFQLHGVELGDFLATAAGGLLCFASAALAA